VTGPGCRARVVRLGRPRHRHRAVPCSGERRDIRDLQAERSEPPTANVGDPYRLTRQAFWAVRHCVVPVICAVSGAAVGAGVVLAAVSDIVLAAESATFALTEINVGVLGAASFAQ
jgi:enoyl-CoA hydratase